MSKYNPFRPGAIVHPGMFAGRTDEIDLLERALDQTRNGNAQHFLIHGERGIGKSSLLLLVGALAQGLGREERDKDAFLTVSLELEPSDSYGDILRKVAREFHRELEKSEQIKTLLKDLWDFVVSWEVMGVKYNRETTPADAMLEELADKVIAVAKKLQLQGKGIYFFIDEADKPPVSSGLGEFVKVFTERLTRRGATNVGIGLSGVSTVIDKMRKSHESAVRVVTPILLEPLKPEERKQVVERGLEEANKRNATPTKIEDEALLMIANVSEGYPHFIQQYAYCAFEEDRDNSIDTEDVKKALVKEGGALQLLGQMFFENMYTDEIRSDDYRKVLQVIARHFPEYMTRKAIAAESGLKQHTVNNALAALTRRGSVVAKKGAMGQFRLPSRSFAAWILAFKDAKGKGGAR